MVVTGTVSEAEQSAAPEGLDPFVADLLLAIRSKKRLYSCWAHFCHFKKVLLATFTTLEHTMRRSQTRKQKSAPNFVARNIFIFPEIRNVIKPNNRVPETPETVYP
eukprot:6474473-Amphidinium_carterae.1